MLAFTLFPMFFFGTLLYRMFTLPVEDLPFECMYSNIPNGENNDLFVFYFCNKKSRTQDFMSTFIEVASPTNYAMFDCVKVDDDMFLCAKVECVNDSLEQNLIERLLSDKRFEFEYYEMEGGSTKTDMYQNLATMKSKKENEKQDHTHDKCYGDENTKKVSFKDEEVTHDEKCVNEVVTQEDYIKLETNEGDDINDKKNI